jgi:threonine dehydrogenase-like Zn-dependent dehydrogenase
MVFCGRCEQCRSGWTNLCPDGGGLGTTADGAFGEYVAVNANQCQAVPSDVPDRWAPLTEPLSCCLHAVDRIGPGLGRQVLVLGAGPAGLLLARLLTLSGATVDVVERDESRRAAALGFGAARWAGALEELEPGRTWEIVADATGNTVAIEEGLARVSQGGTFAIFGVPPSTATASFKPYDVFAREITVVGSNSVRHTFSRALRLIAGGFLDLDLLLSPTIPLAEVATAFDHVRRGQGLKVTLAPGAASGDA